MHKFHISLLSILLLFTLYGCFEVIEEVTLENKDSGNFLYTINMSKSKSKVAVILGLDSFMGLKVPSREKITNQIMSIKSAVAGSPGVSNVKTTEDFVNYIFTIGFSFANVENLSDALKLAILSVDKNIPEADLPSAFIKTENSFQRVAVPDKTDGQKVKSQAAKIALLNGSNYTCIYRFTSPVSSDRSEAILSKDKKAIMYKLDVTALIKDPSKISQTIQIQ